MDDIIIFDQTEFAQSEAFLYPYPLDKVTATLEDTLADLPVDVYFTLKGTPANA